MVMTATGGREAITMYVALFYARLNAAHDPDEYAAMGMRMYELASQMPGFVALHKLEVPDGRELAIAYFETEAQMTAWYNHPEHRQVQRAGRERILDEYLIEVCEVQRSYTKESSYFDEFVRREQRDTAPTPG